MIINGNNGLSLKFFLIILSVVFCVNASKDLFVTLDLISGQAEVQRAGRNEWKAAGSGTNLYNNDILHVLKDSKASIRWKNGNVMYIHPDSKILITLNEDTSNNVLTRHITVFFGAIFYIVEKTLPRGLMNTDDRIYTPTAALAIRGTSFHVSVNGEQGMTNIQTINGVVMIRNILKKEFTYLPAGLQTTVKLNTDPLAPTPVRDSDISDLKKWVPPDIIDEEMKKQIKNAELERYIITGKLQNKILVTPFINNSRYTGKWNIENKMAEFISDKIKRSFEYTEVKTVEKMEGSTPLQCGIENKAMFVLTGTIDEFDIIKRAQISARADEYKELNVATIKMHIRLINVDKKKMVFEGDISGQISGKNSFKNSWKNISSYPLDMKDEKFSQTILARTISQIVEESINSITPYIVKD